MYCLDQATGEERWRFSEADWVGSSPALIADRQWIAIGLEHSLHGRRGSVVALDWRTGGRVWECTVPGLVHGTPLYIAEHDLLAVGTNDRELLILHAETGRIRAIVPVGGDIKSIPAYDPERNQVLAGAWDGKLYSLGLDKLEVRWETATEDLLYCQPLLLDGKAYVTSPDKSLYQIDLETGVVLRRLSLSGRAFGSPRLIGKDVYFGTTAGKMYVVNTETMEVRSSAILHDRITTAFGISENRHRLAVLTNDSSLTCFTLSPFLQSPEIAR